MKLFKKRQMFFLYKRLNQPVIFTVFFIYNQSVNASGEIEADYVNCTLWRKTAENTALYCQKGSLVGVSGRIQTRSYENAEGVNVYVTEVLADTVRFMDPKPREKAAD
ncbi:single-stranded DNA-binding protein [Bacillus subtilis]|uniref:single-stranded DNA-binding protein n=1 Tax=Bacillus subtilis TaxID=1423 RepID=UPI0037BF0536